MHNDKPFLLRAVARRDLRNRIRQAADENETYKYHGRKVIMPNDANAPNEIFARNPCKCRIMHKNFAVVRFGNIIFHLV